MADLQAILGSKTHFWQNISHKSAILKNFRNSYIELLDLIIVYLHAKN